jgi:hypothetical protein
MNAPGIADNEDSREPMVFTGGPGVMSQWGEAAHQGLFVRGDVSGTDVLFLVDTGSSNTVINYEQYLRITENVRPQLIPIKEIIRQADGTPLPVHGKVRTEVGVGGSSATIDVLVADLGNDGILGMDFLLKGSCIVDLKQLQIRCKDEIVCCRTENSRPLCAKVTLQKTVVIPAGEEIIVPAKIVKHGGEAISGTGMMEPAQWNSTEDHGLVFGRSLVDLNNQTIPVRVWNPGREAGVAHEGVIVGRITRVDSDMIVENSPGDGYCKTLSTDTTTEFEMPEHLVDLLERSSQYLTEDEKSQVAKLLYEFQDIFSTGDKDLGQTGLVQHTINTGDAPPARQRYRRLPFAQQAEADKHVDDMLERGVIEPSSSPWASPIVLVKKKDGSTRFCVDYRKLNSLTVKDAYPLPRIDDTLDALCDAKWLSTMDLASGYWQVELEEGAREKSAFAVRGGLFQWRVMPFGMCNAPSTFERLMEKVFTGLHWKILLLYLDDIIVHGKTFGDELIRLRTVLQKLREAGLKLKAKKCHFFQKEVGFLGHVVSEQGIQTDPEKIKSVAEWKTPTCVTEVLSFLGLASYYRRFIKDFATIASPLHKLTEKEKAFDWNEDCETAFQTLKQALTQSPILGYPRPGEEKFILDTDASGQGIGAVLSQVQDGQEIVIAYGSRSLSKTERNYCVTRQELLAVVYFVKYFRQYLYGQEFKVRTDHAALKWLLNFKNPEGQLARWMEVLAEYNFIIEHRAGRSHGNADGLSRRTCKQCGREEDKKEQTGLKERKWVKWEDQSVNDAKEIKEPPNSQVDSQVRVLTLQPEWSHDDMRKAQLQDQDIGYLIEAKEGVGTRPSWEEMQSASRTAKSYWAQWERLEIQQGVLCLRSEPEDDLTNTWRTVVPRKLTKQIVTELHSGKASGHLGQTKTILKVKQRFYWTGLRADVQSCCRECIVCGARRTPNRKAKAALQQHIVGAPMERIAIDLIGPLPESTQGNKHILVIGDYFTKWVEAFALPNQEAVTVATKLVEEVVCRFGVPHQLHSDQGRNFESNVFAEMCKVLGIEKTRTTPYNPKSDGFVERFNRTLIDMVSKMIAPERQQRDWDEKIPFALMAYRSSIQESTGESPTMMMLGREINLPIDSLIEPPVGQEELLDTDYAFTIRDRLQDTWDRARTCLQGSARRQKRYYDKKLAGKPHETGDVVWYLNRPRTQGLSPKLQAKWDGPYLILDRLSTVTYRIQKTKRTKTKIVHFDKLKPFCGQLPTGWTDWSTGTDAKVEISEDQPVGPEKRTRRAPKRLICEQK